MAAHHGPSLGWMRPVAEVDDAGTEGHEGLFIGQGDRYHLGGLLLPHVLSRLIHLSRFRCAGLMSSDFTDVGGHEVRNYGESAVEMYRSGLKLIHAGGETLSLGLVDGYARAADGFEAERFESLMQIAEDGQLSEYVKRHSGQTDDFAYLLASEGAFQGAGAVFHAVGLSAPGAVDPALLPRLREILGAAEFVGVRDRIGADFLEACGIEVERMPCGLSVLPPVCARPLAECRESPAMEELRRRFRRGWFAVETGKVREVDEERLAAALGDLAEEEGAGLVFFDASTRTGGEGASKLEEWLDRFPAGRAAVFGSENVWEVASMILHARLFCGSDLSGRNIAMSGAVPRINVPTGEPAVRSYCDLWEDPAIPVELDGEAGWSAQLSRAFRVAPDVLREAASRLQDRYFESFGKMCEAAGLRPRLLPGESDSAHRGLAARGRRIAEEWFSDENAVSLFRRLKNRSGERAVRRRLRRIFGKVEAAPEEESTGMAR